MIFFSSCIDSQGQELASRTCVPHMCDKRGRSAQARSAATRFICGRSDPRLDDDVFLPADGLVVLTTWCAAAAVASPPSSARNSSGATMVTAVPQVEQQCQHISCHAAGAKAYGQRAIGLALDALRRMNNNQRRHPPPPLEPQHHVRSPLPGIPRKTAPHRLRDRSPSRRAKRDRADRWRRSDHKPPQPHLWPLFISMIATSHPRPP